MREVGFTGCCVSGGGMGDRNVFVRGRGDCGEGCNGDSCGLTDGLR